VQIILLSAWAVVLSRLSGQDHFPIALRSHPSAHQTTLVVDLSGDPDVLQLLERIKETASASGTLEDALQPKQCQTTFNWCGYDQESEAQDRNLPPFGSILAPRSEVELDLQDTGAQIVGAMHYSAELFDSSTIERHVAYLDMALKQMASDTTQRAGNIDILPSSERQLVLQTWNATQKHFPSDQCLHQLFERQVTRTPDAVAVVHEDKSLSYAELNSRANSLAHQLLKLGVQPDMPVAISTERSFGMIIGILAILKAGGAYVPLDPSYTGDRLREILDDVAPTILVADMAGQSAIGEARMSSLTVVDPSTVKQGDHINPQPAQLTSRHLAYVIYTSGSTGKPKGVMMEHQGAVNVIFSRPKLFAITTTSRFLQFAPFSFNHSIIEIFSALTTGATLHLVPSDSRVDRYRLWDYLKTHAITHFSFTPSLAQTCKDMPPLESLQVVVVMGEASSPSLPEILRTVAPNSTINNNYGSTEIFSGLVWKSPKDFSRGTMPIGRPIPNKRVYVLDACGNPVPIGAVGEMHIGGIGLARGYLNKPELTIDKFIADPFSGEPGAMMYKTGDMVRYLPNGNLVYLGRNDHQVKIRGFRVELGEIETRLKDHPLVKEAVVVALGDEAGKRLIAYVTCRDDPQGAQADSTRRKWP
jgi:amino acid adenylation domain-containing protein